MGVAKWGIPLEAVTEYRRVGRRLRGSAMGWGSTCELALGLSMAGAATHPIRDVSRFFVVASRARLRWGFSPSAGKHTASAAGAPSPHWTGSGPDGRGRVAESRGLIELLV